MTILISSILLPSLRREIIKINAKTKTTMIRMTIVVMMVVTNSYPSPYTSLAL